MRLLSDESLLETYYKAIDLDLEEEFIRLLLEEIQRRNIEFTPKQEQWQTTLH
ncbi:sporulation histidine kinase inhibitor Sda [Paenibacillus thermotolerans]|uniref:sporulation histidine kinase inhibitor Sda n=1 Tax=Paenibacillus thermotolerans TaxID=3027807 RepID=UPI00236823DF|nr:MULTISPECIES: sporulation histidine kinase inhibitor Sda [unclassified Paenibacillus]